MDKTHPLSSPMVVRSLDMKRTHFVIVKMVKNYLVMKYHILVSLVNLCMLLHVLAQILFFLSLNKPSIVSFQSNDIGMVSNIYCATSKEQLI